MQMPGDKLLIREGIYPETINNYMAPYSLPSGTDWNNAFTVAAYPGETVVVQRIAIATDDRLNLNLAYWIFDGLHVVNNVPGSDEAIWMRSPDHLRFVNMEVTTEGRDGVFCVHGNGNFIEFINVEVHSCGDLTAQILASTGLAVTRYSIRLNSMTRQDMDFIFTAEVVTKVCRAEYHQQQRNLQYGDRGFCLLLVTETKRTAT